MKSFALTGVTTLETCPVCNYPNVTVEHGFAAEIDGPIYYDHPQKYWHCPVCGPSIVYYIPIEFIVWDKDAQEFIDSIHPDGEISRTIKWSQAKIFNGDAWLQFWRNHGYEIRQTNLRTFV